MKTVDVRGRDALGGWACPLTHVPLHAGGHRREAGAEGRGARGLLGVLALVFTIQAVHTAQRRAQSGRVKYEADTVRGLG